MFSFTDAHDAFYSWIGAEKSALLDPHSAVTVEGRDAVCKFLGACPEYEPHRDALLTAHGGRRFQLTREDWKNRLSE